MLWKFLQIGLAFLYCFVTSCVSNTSLQTGRTPQKSTATVTIGLGYQSLAYLRKSNDPNQKQAEETLESIKVPMIEGGFQYGITNKFAVGGRYTLFGSMIGDAKYNLWGDNSDSAGAIGLSIGYTNYSSGGDGKDDYKIRLTDFHLPFYLSYDFSRDFSIFATPRMVYRMIDTSDQFGSKSESGTMIGVAAGFLYNWFGIEAGYLTALNGAKDSGVFSVMAGIIIGRENTLPKRTERDTESPQKPKKKKKGA